MHLSRLNIRSLQEDRSTVDVTRFFCGIWKNKPSCLCRRFDRTGKGNLKNIRLGMRASSSWRGRFIASVEWNRKQTRKEIETRTFILLAIYSFNSNGITANFFSSILNNSLINGKFHDAKNRYSASRKRAACECVILDCLVSAMSSFQPLKVVFASKLNLHKGLMAISDEDISLRIKTAKRKSTSE